MFSAEGFWSPWDVHEVRLGSCVGRVGFNLQAADVFRRFRNAEGLRFLTSGKRESRFRRKGNVPAVFPADFSPFDKDFDSGRDNNCLAWHRFESWGELALPPCCSLREGRRVHLYVALALLARRHDGPTYGRLVV